MPDERGKVTYSSHLAPRPQRFDLFEEVAADLPKNVRGLLGRNRLARDLWWIAAACFAVDRSLKRPDARAWRQGREWVRRIRAEIPVQEPDWWSRHTHLVQNLLNWLTADDWSLSFTGDPRPPIQDQRSLFPLVDRVALFSGGLDSVCGLINDLEQTDESFRLVSVATNSRMRSVQSEVLTEVRELSHRPLQESSFLLQARLPYHEDTARTRGFVFLTSGVVTALSEGVSELRLYENGPGALNLALTQGQVGAQNARAVHPKTLRYMERLARAVTAEPGFRIENRSFTLTKAQMVKQVPNTYDGALAASVSCDTGFSHHQGGGAPAHCGGCTSCVLRRQALAAAGRNLPAPHRKAPQRKRDHHRLMLWQVARLHHVLREGLCWERMVQEFPDLVCDPDSFLPNRREVLLDLFQGYAEEWNLEQVAAELARIAEENSA